MDELTLKALRVAPEDVGRDTTVRCRRVRDNDELVRVFADDLLEDFRAAKAAGRDKVLFIVPVGPVGQFQLLADRCNAERQSLQDLVLVNMDEYLDGEGRFIPMDDPLSFRRHMQDRLWGRLDPALAPTDAQRIFPDPEDIANVPRVIARYGGVETCFGGVGITGHVAFNDPPEPGETVDEDIFAALPTRIVRLSRETRTINAVTAARGNIDRIPELAVTVGMKEILGARRVRIYMNRPWQCAMIRKFLHGPVTHHVPVSLLRRHPDCRLVFAEEVAQLPEPTLR
jgi:glucosamine-6-phosphate deaminase